jgi:hypothetical protein
VGGVMVGDGSIAAAIDFCVGTTLTLCLDVERLRRERGGWGMSMWGWGNCGACVMQDLFCPGNTIIIQLK